MFIRKCVRGGNITFLVLSLKLMQLTTVTREYLTRLLPVLDVAVHLVNEIKTGHDVTDRSHDSYFDRRIESEFDGVAYSTIRTRMHAVPDNEASFDDLTAIRQWISHALKE